MEAGDPSARGLLMELVYQNLHDAAQYFVKLSRPGGSLTPTVLVHEFFLKLSESSDLSFDNRQDFFNFARKVMRGIIADYFRYKHAQKRGGARQDLILEEIDEALVMAKAHHPLLGEALSELERIYPLQSQIVELRFFFGFTHDQVAEFLGASRATVRREWEFARIWIYQFLSNRAHAPQGPPLPKN